MVFQTKKKFQTKKINLTKKKFKGGGNTDILEKIIKFYHPSESETELLYLKEQFCANNNFRSGAGPSISLEGFGIPFITCNPKNKINAFVTEYNDKFGADYNFPETEIVKDSSINFCNTHGEIINTDFSNKVPPKTIICFLSPVNVNTGFDKRDRSFLYNFKDLQHTMEKSKYLELFKFRNHMRYVNDNSEYRTTIRNREIRDMDYYNSCFKNSVWYYPGQAYPEMNLSVSYYDIENVKEGLGTLAYEIQMTAGQIKFKKNDFFGMSKDAVLLELFNKTKMSINLSEYISQEYDFSKYQLMLMTPCRPVDNVAHLKPLLEYEKFVLFLNLELEKKNDSSLESTASSSKKFPELCGMNKNYDTMVFETNKKPYVLIPQIKTYLETESYEVYKLCTEVKRKQNIDVRDVRKMLNFKPKHILLFFIKLKQLNLEKQFVKIAGKTLTNYYDFTFRSIMKNIQHPILLHCQYKEQHKDYLTQILELISFFKGHGLFRSFKLKGLESILQKIEATSSIAEAGVKYVYMPDEILISKPLQEELNIFCSVDLRINQNFGTLKKLIYNVKNYNTYTPLPLDHLYQYKNLEHLEIDSISIDEIDLIHFPNLQYLELNRTHTKKIINLKTCSKLKILKIRGSNLTRIIIPPTCINLNIAHISQTPDIVIFVNKSLKKLELGNFGMNSQIRINHPIETLTLKNIIFITEMFQSTLDPIPITNLEYKNTEFVEDGEYASIFSRLKPRTLVIEGFIIDKIVKYYSQNQEPFLKSIQIKTNSDLTIDITHLQNVPEIKIIGDNIAYKKISRSIQKKILRRRGNIL